METEKVNIEILRRWGSIGVLLGALGGLPWGAAGPDPAAPTSEEPRTRAWLGVWVSDAVDGGVELVAVAPGGPAQRAGLLRGDIVLEAGGATVRGEDAVGRLLLQRRPGDVLELIVLRGGESIQARVQLGQRPRAAAAVPRIPDRSRTWREAYSSYERARKAQRAPFGLQAVLVTPALRAYFGAPEMAGVLVTRVEPGMFAEQVGIRVGDLLLSIDEIEITDPSRLRDLLLTRNRAEPLRAKIVRGREPRVLRIGAPQSARPSEPQAPAAEWREALQEARLMQQERERAVLVLEIERLERRVEELKRNVEQLRDER